ncbi:MAG: peptidylprolyl isomerase [Candidatus Aenigmarchaeota archaeon]|nr:peptidylprolyl isomerase [Candidatus Aenigmarchaeota archaeon]
MEKGQFVRVNYVGRLESGEIFDLTDEETAKKEKVYDERIKYKPMPVIVGAGFLIPGLDKALHDMNIGEKKTIELKPEEGFGQRDPKLVRVVPRNVFEGKVDPKPGMVVDFSGMRGRIQSAEAGRIRVDFNNPLSGKILKYEIEITEEIKDPADQVKAVLEFFGADNADIELKEHEVDIKIKLPEQLKERLSSLLLEHIAGIEKVNFIDTYTKKS